MFHHANINTSNGRCARHLGAAEREAPLREMLQAAKEAEDREHEREQEAKREAEKFAIAIAEVKAAPERMIRGPGLVVSAQSSASASATRGHPSAARSRERPRGHYAPF